MARFRRQLDDRQRAAMIRRKMEVARKLRGKPGIAVQCSATSDRSAGKNAIIFNTHRKRGRGLKLTKTDIKRVMAAVDDLRQQVMRGDASAVRRLLEGVGKHMSDAVSDKVGGAGLRKTGQLLNSIGYKVKNA